MVVVVVAVVVVPYCTVAVTVVGLVVHLSCGKIFILVF